MQSNKTRNSATITAFLFLLLSGTACHKQESPPPAAQPVPAASASGALQPGAAPSTAAVMPADLNVDANGLSKVTVTIATKKGNIKFKFFSKDAPTTSGRMVELIQKGFYNGLIFHRVENWVIQGGDPTGTGTGGSGQRLKAEFNARKHKEGTVGMARSMDPDSADSQFYITFGTQPHLDNQYTVFGQVIEGMDVARKTEKGDVMSSVTLQ